MVILLLTFFISSVFANEQCLQEQSFSEMTRFSEMVSEYVNDPCAFAEDAKIPTSKKELCEKPKEYFQQILCMKEGKLGQSNAGGLFGLETGVCWWNSRFHRNATYLGYYAKDKPRWDYNTKEGKKTLETAIRRLINSKSIVEIPGYSNLREFTEDPYVRKVLQKKLQAWMAKDTFLNFSWIKGLVGRSNKKEHQDQINKQIQRLEELDNEVNNQKKVSFVLLQEPGLVAHAAIVFGMHKGVDEEGNEYVELKVQDSNYQRFHREKHSPMSYRKLIFKKGSWYESESNGNNIKKQDYLIYPQRDREVEKTQRVLAEECSIL